MNILVTGANGFIAKNLIVNLQEHKDFNILKFFKGDSAEYLESCIRQCDVIFHLAGVNRPNSTEEFKIINQDLTELICNLIIKTNKDIPIFFSSSTQFDNGSPYGESKRKAEIILQNLISKKFKSLYIYRLPGIFGKWSKPDYNSVVSTFCHNIANDKPISISDENKFIELAYIDDLVESFMENLKNIRNGVFYPKIQPTYEITLGDLANQIQKFKNCRENLMLEKVGTGLTRALYSTYMSYLPKSKYSYPLKSHDDERGSFVEMLKTQDSGQFSYFTAHPGVTRGCHYHHSKTEKFLIIKGKARFRFKHIISNEYFEIFIDESKPVIVETIPGWSHDIKNIGNDLLIVMLWANEVFNPIKPDTFQSEIKK